MARQETRIAIRKSDEAPKGEEALRLWLRLLTVTRLMEKQVRARFRQDFQTTLPRFDCMAALSRQSSGQTMGNLSRWLLVTNGNVTGIISHLEKEGLAVRTRSSEDRRARWVRLTTEGNDQFKKQARAHEQWITDMLSGLTADEMTTLHRFLEKIDKRLAEYET